MVKRILFFGLLALMVALIAPASCDDTGRKQATLDSGSFSTAEGRSTRLTRLVRSELPGRILDAQFYEERVSGGSFPPGPSDYEFFARIVIDPSEASAWLAAMPRIVKPGDVPAPPASVDWWMSPAEASTVTYHDPARLFGRRNGFIALTKDQTTIYVWTFTL